MSLRAKLVISFTGLLLLVIAAVGLVASRSVETILVGQIDETLTGFADRGPGPSPDQDRTEPRDEPREEPVHSATAEVFVGADGSVVGSKASGFIDDPDPLPDVSEIGQSRGLMYLDSIDGSLEYRAYVDTFPDGGLLVRAVPLDEVAGASASLVRTLLLAGLGVLLVGGAATWWAVDRSMQPVGEMVVTAEAIAAGDLTRRVPDVDSKTELGRLGTSLNDMLAHIEEAVINERQGRERLRQFVGDASHELRTPITAISGYAELRRKGGLESPDAEDRAWSRIESESGRMGSIVEDLLVLARLGQRLPLDLEPVNIAQIARDAATDHRAIDSEREVTVDAPDSLVVTGDDQRLHQVVSNLLANTRVHTPSGTKVFVEVEDVGDCARVTVSDDGPGIPEQAIEQVFERFYRADPSRSRRSGGSGLGLAIVQAVVSAHGGQVEASNPEGGGARFTVSLPKSGPTDVDPSA